MSYHNGSVWLHDNALRDGRICLLRKTRVVMSRFSDRAFSLSLKSTYVDRILNSSAAHAAGAAEAGSPYPVACVPEIWARRATQNYPFQSCLGLSFEAEANRVIFRRPVLPDFLDEITLTGLSVPAGRINVQIRRANRGFVVDVLDRSAAIEVLTIN